jgi:hypothetical protein
VAALARVKANGKALGSPSLHLAREASAAVVSAEADRFAATVLPFIKEAQKAGATMNRVSDPSSIVDWQATRRPQVLPGRYR